MFLRFRLAAPIHFIVGRTLRQKGKIMEIFDVTKRRDDEIVIHYSDNDGAHHLRAYPKDIIAWHRAAQQSVNADGGNAMSQTKAECEDCHLPYESFMLDVTLPDEQWLAIHPSGKNGLLCARCIVARASKLSNVIAVRAVFDLG